MKRKNIIIALAAIMALSATACGDKTDSSDNSSKKISVVAPSSSGTVILSSSDVDSSSSVDIDSSTDTSVADSETESTEDTTPEESSAASIDTSAALAELTPYSPKNEEEEAVMNAFDTAVKAVKDEDLKNIILYTSVTDLLHKYDGVSLGGYVGYEDDDITPVLMDAEKHKDDIIGFANLSDLQIADDGSYVITNMEKVPDEGIELEGELPDDKCDEYYQKYGFTMIQFHTEGMYLNFADAGYLVTFSSVIDGTMTENTLAMAHVAKENEPAATPREWFLDLQGYKTQKGLLDWVVEHPRKH